MRYVTLDSLTLPDAPICYGILMPGDHVPEGVPYVKVRDFTEHGIETDSIRRTSATIDAEFSRSRLKSGDLILSIRGTTGLVATTPNELNGGNITQDSARIRTADRDREFVGHALKSPAVQRQIQLWTIGQAVKGINIARVRRLEIPWPAARARKAFSRVLSAADRAIQAADKLVAAKREFKRGLMQDLLTGRRRFPGFEGAWEEWSIGKLFREVERTVAWSDDDEYRLISVRRRSGGVFERERRLGNTIKTKALKTVAEDDFVIARMQVLHGALAVVPADFSGAHVSGSYLTFELALPETLDIRFWKYLICQKHIYHLAYLSSYGVAIEKMTFNLELWERQVVCIPPSLDEQRAISGLFSSLDAEITHLESLAAHLREQKRGLMQRLFSGELDLSALDADAATDAAPREVSA